MLAAAVTAFILSTSGDVSVPDFAPAGPTTQLWCERPAHSDYTVRRVSLIDGPLKNGEVALTAGHRLEYGMDCHLRTGFESIPAQIIQIGDTRRAIEDWAIVTTDVAFTGHVDRFLLALVIDETFSARMLISAGVAPPCNVFQPPQDYGYPDAILLHDCQSLPGRSGSPFIAANTDGNVIVGINLGRVYDQNGAGDTSGFLRLIDRELAETIIALR